MENYVSAQLLSFLQSILLGLLCGMLYHLLRTLRTMKLRAAWLMHTLDGIYAVLFLLALFLLALQQGDGELRLYMLLGVALGLASYFFIPQHHPGTHLELLDRHRAVLLRSALAACRSYPALGKIFRQHGKKSLLFLV